MIYTPHLQLSKLRLEPIFQKVYPIIGRTVFRIKSFPAWLKVAVVFAMAGVPILAFGGMFWVPDHVAFSFGGTTCVSKPSLFPSVNSKTDGETFRLEQLPSASFGTTPIYSAKTCVYLHTQPTKNVTEQLSIKTPIGLKSTIRIATPAIPELTQTDSIDPNISGKDGMSFTLTTTDNTFTYKLVIAESTLACKTRDLTVYCPFKDIAFEQGKLYPYTIRRLIGSTEPIVIFSGQVQTAEPLIIAPQSVQPDQTVFTHISEITFAANKAIRDIGEVTLQTESGSQIPVKVSVTDTVISIKADAPLPRETTFVIKFSSAQATDNGYLAAPFELKFSTSGGPRVSGANIPKISVPLTTQFVITTDIDLDAKQDIASLVNFSLGGNAATVTASVNQNTIVVVPTQPLPKCSDFTLSLADGSISVYGVGGGKSWSYTARTICHDKVTIGSSVAGRAITAYKFGSGSRKVMFVGGMHGSEKSSVRTLDAWINELEANFQRIPGDKTVIVIPNLNPDGYVLGSRTNARAVDLNRNFPSNDWSLDVYQPGNVLLPGGGGPHALSEPESSALALYILAINPEVVLTYHAVARTVIYNGSGNSYSLGQLYAQKSGFGLSGSESEDGVFNYPTTGELETWLHDIPSIPTLLVENATMSSNELKTQSPAMWAIIE